MFDVYISNNDGREKVHIPRTKKNDLSFERLEITIPESEKTTPVIEGIIPEVINEEVKEVVPETIQEEVKSETIVPEKKKSLNQQSNK